MQIGHGVGSMNLPFVWHVSLKSAWSRSCLKKYPLLHRYVKLVWKSMGKPSETYSRLWPVGSGKSTHLTGMHGST